MTFSACVARRGVGSGVAARRAVAFVGVFVCAHMMIACSQSAGDLSSGAVTSGSLAENSMLPVTGYQAASAFAPTGHSVSGLDDGRVRVSATGSATTPADRLHKIALARAAEYGAQENKRFFSAGPPASTFRCDKGQRIERGTVSKQPARGYTVVSIDVTYADKPVDASFQPSKASFEGLRQASVADPVPPDVQASTAAAVVAHCKI